MPLLFLRLRRIVLIACVALCQSASPAVVAGDRTFVMGTDGDETTLFGKWYRRIFDEAFRRLGFRLEFVTLPAARLTAEMDQGLVDFQPARVSAYADAHPNQIRVAEPVTHVRLMLYSVNPVVAPTRLEDVLTTDWVVEYRRGVAVCENALKPLLPATRLSSITATAQGLKKLGARRTDLYCDIDLAVVTELLSPEFAGTPPPRPVLQIGSTIPLFPYVHKKHADLAAPLAEVLRQMRTEGLIDRYRQETQRELATRAASSGR